MRQKLAVFGAKVVHEGRETGPELVLGHTGTGQRLRGNEIRQFRVNMQPVFFYQMRHRESLFATKVYDRKPDRQ